ncbi:hypothetical protein BGI30_11655 [Snodgrassella alvi]|nr:hypothetical protein BGI30_11655 [Snodgrassella alvi]PIT57741.1 hypothetical protein BHC59_02340 [Snodgrassella alvi]
MLIVVALPLDDSLLFHLINIQQTIQTLNFLLIWYSKSSRTSLLLVIAYQPRTIEPWQVIYAVHRVVNQQQVI